MSDQLIKLSKIDASGTFNKETIFNWIVDLRQDEFDDLCNQIISLYKFQSSFEGVLVSDEVDLLKPWLPVLEKIEFTVSASGENFQKNNFYRFLSRVEEPELESICEEILSLYSHARENNGTYMVSQIYPAVAGHVECWRIQFKRARMFTDMPKEIMHWQKLIMEIN